MNTKTQRPLPKWFNGVCYPKGDIVSNPYTGEEAELSPEELSMYDFIIGAEQVITRGIFDTKSRNKMISEFRRGIDWFRRSNPDAYMILLD